MEAVAVGPGRAVTVGVDGRGTGGLVCSLRPFGGGPQAPLGELALGVGAGPRRSGPAPWSGRPSPPWRSPGPSGGEVTGPEGLVHPGVGGQVPPRDKMSAASPIDAPVRAASHSAAERWPEAVWRWAVGGPGRPGSCRRTPGAPPWRTPTPGTRRPHRSSDPARRHRRRRPPPTRRRESASTDRRPPPPTRRLSVADAMGPFHHPGVTTPKHTEPRGCDHPRPPPTHDHRRDRTGTPTGGRPPTQREYSEEIPDFPRWDRTPIRPRGSGDAGRPGQRRHRLHRHPQLTHRQNGVHSAPWPTCPGSSPSTTTWSSRPTSGWTASRRSTRTSARGSSAPRWARSPSSAASSR